VALRFRFSPIGNFPMLKVVSSRFKASLLINLLGFSESDFAHLEESASLKFGVP
jgi:hypothetical protein